MTQLSIINNIIIFLLLIVVDCFSLFFLFKACLNNPLHGIVKESVTSFYVLFTMSIYFTFWIVGCIFFFIYAMVIERASPVYNVNAILFMIALPTITCFLIWYKTRKTTILWKHLQQICLAVSLCKEEYQAKKKLWENS